MITALLFAVYAAASAALPIYRANCYILVVLFLRRHRSRAAGFPSVGVLGIVEHHQMRRVPAWVFAEAAAKEA